MMCGVYFVSNTVLYACTISRYRILAIGIMEYQFSGKEMPRRFLYFCRVGLRVLAIGHVQLESLARRREDGNVGVIPQKTSFSLVYILILAFLA